MKDNYDDPRMWTGFDLDYTAAEGHSPYRSEMIGEPIPKIIELMKEKLAEGKRVKIFTARVCVTNQRSPWSDSVADKEYANFQHMLITNWSIRNLGIDLEVTCVKDFLCEEIYDDRAWRVEKNTGMIIGREPRRHYCSVSGYPLPTHESEIS